MLRGSVLSWMSFVSCFLVIGLAMETTGFALSLALGAISVRQQRARWFYRSTGALLLVPDRPRLEAQPRNPSVESPAAAKGMAGSFGMDRRRNLRFWQLDDPKGSPE